MIEKTVNTEVKEYIYISANEYWKLINLVKAISYSYDDHKVGYDITIKINRDELDIDKFKAFIAGAGYSFLSRDSENTKFVMADFNY